MFSPEFKVVADDLARKEGGNGTGKGPPSFPWEGEEKRVFLSTHQIFGLSCDQESSETTLTLCSPSLRGRDRSSMQENSTFLDTTQSIYKTCPGPGLFV